MSDRREEIRAFTQQMSLRERVYWVFCSEQKKEAILDIRRQLHQEMDEHANGVVEGIGYELRRRG